MGSSFNGMDARPDLMGHHTTKCYNPLLQSLEKLEKLDSFKTLKKCESNQKRICQLFCEENRKTKLTNTAGDLDRQMANRCWVMDITRVGE